MAFSASFTSSVKLIPKYFVLCDAVLDRIAFAISLLDGASLADRNAQVFVCWFCIFVFHRLRLLGLSFRGQNLRRFCSCKSEFPCSCLIESFHFPLGLRRGSDRNFWLCCVESLTWEKGRTVTAEGGLLCVVLTFFPYCFKICLCSHVCACRGQRAISTVAFCCLPWNWSQVSHWPTAHLLG